MTKAPYLPEYSWMVMARLHNHDGEWHCVFPTHSWEKAHERYVRRLNENPDEPVRIVCEMSAFAVVPMCLHCHQQIDNHGDPDMGGNHHTRWVHIPGGHSICFPQQKNSPRAEPTAPSVEV